MLPFNEM